MLLYESPANCRGNSCGHEKWCAYEDARNCGRLTGPMGKIHYGGAPERTYGTPCA